MNIEDEIDVLESTLSNIEMAIKDIADTPYHSYLANSWELDMEEIKSRLDELYTLQDEQWSKEIEAQNLEYERLIL